MKREQGIFEVLGIRDWVDLVYSPLTYKCLGAVLGFEAFIFGVSWALNVLYR